MTWEYIATLLVATTLVLFVRSRIARSKLPYPPGPKSYPLVGNFLDIPKTQEWKTYAEWSETYDSDIIHLDLPGGAHVLIANTAEACVELFEKRATIYSERPHLPMLVDLAGWDFSFGVFHYDSKWKLHRRLFYQHFNDKVSPKYQPAQRKAAREMLHNFVQRPEEYLDQIRLMTASMMLNVAYGMDVQSADEPIVRMVEKAMATISQAGSPGSFVVDSLPILKHVPTWFPGAHFKRLAKEWRVSIQASADIPLQYVKDEMAKGNHVECVTSLCLEEAGDKGNLELQEAIRGVSATVYASGADTLVFTMVTFIMAMVLHPEAYKKAQEEIDRVVGKDRLPEFSDAESLPYISAVIKEVMRWNPVTPLALGHRLKKDDIYNGKYMPANSFVLGNAWAILHDEKVYPDPHSFKPERWLKDGKLNPEVPSPDALFGFGRRSCPGKFFAHAIIFISVASITTAFEIKKAIDENGNEITPSPDSNNRFLYHPEPFKCSIKPRSAKALTVVNDAYAEYHPSS